MTRGRKPKPTAVKKLAGNPGKRALNGAEARVDMRLPQCPRWLGKAAKREWRRVAKRLHEAGLMGYVDRSLLAAYCVAYGRWVEAETALEGQELVLTSEKGGVYQNPLVGVARSAMKDMVAIGREFGMGPSARSRIRVPEGEDEGSLADALFEAVMGDG